LHRAPLEDLVELAGAAHRMAVHTGDDVAPFDAARRCRAAGAHPAHQGSGELIRKLHDLRETGFEVLEIQAEPDRSHLAPGDQLVHHPLRHVDGDREADPLGPLVDRCVDADQLSHGIQKGSPAIVEENEREVRADLLLLGISLRADTKRFVYRMVEMIDPQILMPMHYDFFFRPLRKGLRLVPRTRFGQVVDEARDAKPEIQIVTLPLLGEYRVRF
jgi:hypothetical protein